MERERERSIRSLVLVFLSCASVLSFLIIYFSNKGKLDRIFLPLSSESGANESPHIPTGSGLVEQNFSRDEVEDVLVSNIGAQLVERDRLAGRPWWKIRDFNQTIWHVDVLNYPPSQVKILKLIAEEKMKARRQTFFNNASFACGGTDLQSVRRVALGIRGGAFRQAFSAGQRSCGKGTFEVQHLIWKSVHENIIEAFENQHNAKVDVFMMTIPCHFAETEWKLNQTFTLENRMKLFKEKNELYMNTLKEWYKPVVFDVLDSAKEGLRESLSKYTRKYSEQGRFAEGLLRHVRQYSLEAKVTYDDVLLIRADEIYAKNFFKIYKSVPEGIVQNKNLPFYLDFSEDQIRFSGCALKAVIDELSSGCLERSPFSGFGHYCGTEFGSSGFRFNKAVKFQCYYLQVKQRIFCVQGNYTFYSLLFIYSKQLE
mmetsp:Transcript_8652/g.10214  ORF Transcript_8652/g.10214 Transcript_8652/m.10214 type:complete len:427 (+) Transcript_8652:40-1320(+)